METIIGGLTFDGPFKSVSLVENNAGLYAVMRKVDDGYEVLDYGESSLIRACLQRELRLDTWKINGSNDLFFAAHYTPGQQQPERMTLEMVVRSIAPPESIIPDSSQEQDISS